MLLETGRGRDVYKILVRERLGSGHFEDKGESRVKLRRILVNNLRVWKVNLNKYTAKLK